MDCKQSQQKNFLLGTSNNLSKSNSTFSLDIEFSIPIDKPTNFTTSCTAAHFGAIIEIDSEDSIIGSSAAVHA